MIKGFDNKHGPSLEAEAADFTRAQRDRIGVHNAGLIKEPAHDALLIHSKDLLKRCDAARMRSR